MPKPPVEITTKDVMTIAPAFKLVLWIALFLTVLSYAGSIILAVLPNQTSDIGRLIETSSTTYKMGFGAIIGLLGGKVLP
jgi:hypothetical protein